MPNMFPSPHSNAKQVTEMDPDSAYEGGFVQGAAANMESTFGGKLASQPHTYRATYNAIDQREGEQSLGSSAYGNISYQATDVYQRTTYGTSQISPPRQVLGAMGQFTYGSIAHQPGSFHRYTSMRSQQEGVPAMGNFSYGNPTQAIDVVHHSSRLEYPQDPRQGMGSLGDFSHMARTIQTVPSHFDANAQEFIPRQENFQGPVQAPVPSLELIPLGRGEQFGAFQVSTQSQFPDADKKYPVEDYDGPVTPEGIEGHFLKKMPFAPSKYVIETRRAAQARYTTGFSQLPFGDLSEVNVAKSPSVAAAKAVDEAIASSVGMTKSKKAAYKGDLDLEDEWLPDDLNCKLFVTGVHPDATRKEIFDAIRDGKVNTFAYNKAIPPKFRTAAFSISFADRESSDRCLKRADVEGIFIRGLRVKVVRDRTKTRALEEWERSQTRVVRVYGPPGSLSLDRLVHVLKKFIKFELVHGTENTIDRGQRSVVTIHFESIVGQSRSAIKCLMNLAKEEGLENDVRTRYQPDPCDPFPDFVDRDRLDNPEY